MVSGFLDTADGNHDSPGRSLAGCNEDIHAGDLELSGGDPQDHFMRSVEDLILAANLAAAGDPYAADWVANSSHEEVERYHERLLRVLRGEDPGDVL